MDGDGDGDVGLLVQPQLSHNLLTKLSFPLACASPVQRSVAEDFDGSKKISFRLFEQKVQVVTRKVSDSRLLAASH